MTQATQAAVNFIVCMYTSIQYRTSHISSVNSHTWLVATALDRRARVEVMEKESNLFNSMN